MKIAFTKMHGIGNDYIYVNCMGQVAAIYFHFFTAPASGRVF